MVNKKSEFIKGILDYAATKKADDSTTKRLVGLVSKEIDRADSVYDDVLRRLDNLEMQTDIQEPLKKDNSPDEMVHNPSNCIEYFRKFTKDDQLKFFTHETSSQISCDYLDVKIYSKKIINPSSAIRIKNFIFNKDPKKYWLDYKGKKVSYSWALIKQDWCDKNEGKWPNSVESVVTITVDGRKDLKTFGQVVDLFKNTIEFRSDNPDLYQCLKDNLKLGVDFKSLDLREIKNTAKNVVLYIDKSLFLAGIRKINDWIVKFKHNSTKVDVLLTDKDNYFELVIRHHGSYFNHAKDIDGNLNPKINGLNGDMAEIRKTLFGVCDLTIRTKFVDGKVYDIVCLKKGNDKMNKESKKMVSKNRVIEVDEETVGVEYRLKLYKK